MSSHEWPTRTTALNFIDSDNWNWKTYIDLLNTSSSSRRGRFASCTNPADTSADVDGTTSIFFFSVRSCWSEKNSFHFCSWELNGFVHPLHTYIAPCIVSDFDCTLTSTIPAFQMFPIRTWIKLEYCVRDSRISFHANSF